MTATIPNPSFIALREFISMDSPTAHYPVAVSEVLALAEEYAKLPDALQPLPVRKFSTVPFKDLPDVQKLTQVYKELEGANSCGTLIKTVPASWVKWLLERYDRRLFATTFSPL